VNESMVGAKNQPPSGFNPAFVSSASARWETLEQRLERSIREDQALVTKLPWQDALKRIYQSATDVELKALARNWLAAGPRQVMADKITTVMAVNNCTYTEALDQVKLAEPALVGAAPDTRPRDRALLDDNVPPGPMPGENIKGAGTRRDRDRATLAAAFRPEASATYRGPRSLHRGERPIFPSAGRAE
jgi:hypothetical protein